MKVEYNQDKPVKKHRKRRSKGKRILIAFISIVVVLAVTVTLMLTVFFNVNNVKVLGSSIYTENEIVFASGIVNGDNIIRMSAEDIEQRLEEALPYIKNATVKKSLPDTIGIEVTPAEEKYIVETADTTYVCDTDYKALRTVTDRPEGILRIKGITTDGISLGKTIEFSNNQQRDVLTNLLTICSDKGFDVTYVNIENMVDIGFSIANRLYIKLGSYTDLAAKITHLETMLYQIDKDVTASISLVSWSLSHKEAVLKYEDITNLIK